MSVLQRFFVLVIALSAAQVSMADGNLPAALIRLPESLLTVFVAETSTARFHRFERTGEGIVHKGSYYMSIGQKGPGKEREGDRRTPLGAYFVTEQLDTSQLHEKYGVTAFPLDYPNAWDRQAGRDGDGIWVHGVDPEGGQRPIRDTDGCIALGNEDIAMLIPVFKDNITPVLVTREVSWVDSSNNAAIQMELESRIAAWVDSRASGDLYTYLSFYDDEFERWGMDKAEWSSFSLQTAGQQAIKDVTISDLLLLGYPDEEGLYLSRFRQIVKEEHRDIVSTARLYWRRSQNGMLKIVAQDDG